MDYDIVIIGAGVVGLSIAKEVSTLKKNILVIKKMKAMGWKLHQDQVKLFTLEYTIPKIHSCPSYV